MVVYAGNKVKKYSVKKHDTGNTGTMFSADVSPEIARQSATVVVTQAIRLRNTQSSCRRNSDER